MLEKIRSIDEMAALAERARLSGKKVVLAHGVFDILHVGHKRHFDIGKSHGDLLFVTVTTDSHVNKGPGRPVFPDKLRAEMLAAMAAIDCVGISPNPSAEFVIEKIKPEVYLKGSEYSVADNDVTGAIIAERVCVEKFGGRVVFTEDITFSSSGLANRSMKLYPDDAANYLTEFRSRITLQDITGPLQALRDKRCLIIGDTILDEYIYVEPLGKPSKENIIATRYLRKELFCGGVLATANLAAQFCGAVDVVTLLGKADSYEELIRNNLADNVRLIPFFREGAQTTVKSRLVDPGYMKKLVEVAYLNDELLPAANLNRINEWVESEIGNYDMVIVNDFGHGMIESDLIALLCDRARFLAVNAQTNSANRGFNLVTKYPRADLVCIDEPEARLAVADRHSPIERIVDEKLRTRISCANFIVTHGKLGCLVYSNASIHRIPALIEEAIDTIGAGDAFFSIAAPLVASGSDPILAAFVGNAVGAMKIRIVGQRHQITKAEVIKYLTSLMK